MSERPGGPAQGGKESGRGMCRGALTAATAVVIALLAAGNAGAATPQQIYRDLADNNRLDGTYSRADIERAFGGNPSLPGYVRRPVAEAQRVLQQRQSAPTPAGAEPSGRSLPFTGLDAALLALVGGPLLLLGFGMRFARVQTGKVT
jgi:hypothetical protein